MPLFGTPSVERWPDYTYSFYRKLRARARASCTPIIQRPWTWNFPLHQNTKTKACAQLHNIHSRVFEKNLEKKVVKSSHFKHNLLRNVRSLEPKGLSRVKLLMMWPAGYSHCHAYCEPGQRLSLHVVYWFIMSLYLKIHTREGNTLSVLTFCIMAVWLYI